MRPACHIGALIAAGLITAAPALGQDAGAPTAPGTHYAYQVCVWPDRYDRCVDKCDWKKRRYEESGDCFIDPAPGAYSTCREREVISVRACLTRCKADFCPQYNP